MTFTEQYKHPEWQKERLEVLESRGFTCEECRATDKELHVHHPFYAKGAKVWEYDTEDLQCLCLDCHEYTHLLDTKLKRISGTLTLRDKLRLIGYADAMSHLSGGLMRLPDENYQRGFIDKMRTEDRFLAYLINK